MSGVYLTAAQMRAGLRALYAAPEWALAFEVRDAVAHNARRSADAVAMNTWPSRGLSIHGIEIKVSRGDWRNELANPAKAEAVGQYCDFWWIVAPRGVVPRNELPELWGLREFDGQKWFTVKDAPRKEAKEISRQFLAPFLRRACEVDADELDALVQAKDTEREKSFTARVDREVSERTRRYAELKQAVEAFEAASGLKITDWNIGDVGKAVALIKEVGIPCVYSGARKIHGDLISSAERIDSILKEVGLEVVK